MTLPFMLRIDKQRPNVSGHGVRDGKSDQLRVNFDHPPASVTLDRIPNNRSSLLGVPFGSGDSDTYRHGSTRIKKR
jgi:hypothetical protein